MWVISLDPEEYISERRPKNKCKILVHPNKYTSKVFFETVASI